MTILGVLAVEYYFFAAGFAAGLFALMRCILPRVPFQILPRFVRLSPLPIVFISFENSRIYFTTQFMEGLFIAHPYIQRRVIQG